MLCREDAMDRTRALMRRKVVYRKMGKEKDNVDTKRSKRRVMIYRRPWLLASLLLVLLLLLLLFR